MYNLYNISLNLKTLSVTGIAPAQIIFDPTFYTEIEGEREITNLIYKISYNFESDVYQDVIYTVYPDSYNLNNIIPLTTTVFYNYNNIGTHYCYISVYEIGTDVNVITAIISLSANDLVDLYLLKSSVYNVKNDTLYVFENDYPNTVLPVYLNWEDKKTKYIDPLQYPTPTPTPTISVTPTFTPTNTVTPTPTITFTLTPSQTPTPTITVTPTLTPTISITPTNTVTPTFTPTATPTTTPTPTVTPSQTFPRIVSTDYTYRFSGKGIFRYKIAIPIGYSFNFTFDAGQVPDKFSIFSADGSLIYTSGWVGQPSYNYALSILGEPAVTSSSSDTILLTNNTLFDFIIVEAKSVFSTSKGEFTVVRL